MFDFFKSEGANSASMAPQEPNSKVEECCPHCGVVLEIVPKRKMKCKECKNPMVIRSKKTLYTRAVLTETEAIHTDFYNDLEYNGATKEMLNQKREQLAKQWGWKPKGVDMYDILWWVANDLPMHFRKDPVEMFYKQKVLAIPKALYQMNRGHDPFGYLQGGHDADIEHTKIQRMQWGGDPSEIRIKIANYQCCEACKSISFKDEYAADEAKGLLPIKECTRKLKNTDKFNWCICWFEIH